MLFKNYFTGFREKTANSGQKLINLGTRYLKMLGYDKSQAEEIVQEVFEKLLTESNHHLWSFHITVTFLKEYYHV